MLVDGVVAAVESGGADVEALLVGDFFGDDQARGVASARGGYGGVVGMREGVAQSHSGRGSLDEFAGTAGFEHAGLRGHVGKSFYTVRKDLTGRAQRTKRAQRKRKGTDRNVCPTFGGARFGDALLFCGGGF